MKHYLILPLVLFIASTLSAQSWAEIGTQWTYSESYATSAALNPFFVTCTKDTLWQGKHCKFLVKSAPTCDFRPAAEIMYQDSGRVYFYDSLTSSFQLFYDINSSPGQSWVNYPSGYQSGDSIVTIVDSTGIVTINSFSLKELFVHYRSAGLFYPRYGANTTDTILEFIGNKNSMFPWVSGVCDMNFVGPLRCYTDSSIGFYDFHTVPSNVIDLTRKALKLRGIYRG